MQANKDYRSPDLGDYKKFFDDTPVALIRTDLESGKILMANNYAAEMLGFKSLQEMMEHGNILDYYEEEDRNQLIRFLRKNTVVKNYEIKLKPPSGPIWVSARLRINCDGTCIEGSLIDITETVKLREQNLHLLREIGKKLDTKIAALAG